MKHLKFAKMPTLVRDGENLRSKLEKNKALLKELPSNEEF